MQYYPLKLRPVLKDAIWGGERLKKDYCKQTDASRVAEAWELTVREKEQNVIENGPYAGMTLTAYLEACGQDVSAFPLLVKWIDANDRLSIQVHPAKTEMWYIAAAEEGASIVYDSQGTSPDVLRAAIENGTLESLLTVVPVHVGEVYFIPSGLVHAIGAGIVVAEIQQNSDVTYRLYDYMRRQADGSLRQLHVEEGLSCIRPYSEEELHRLQFENGRSSEHCIAACPYFTVDRYDFSASLVLPAAPTFRHVLILEGAGTLAGEAYRKGDSFFLPVGISEVTFLASEKTTLFVSYV